jgi:hypothetical protein
MAAAVDLGIERRAHRLLVGRHAGVDRSPAIPGRSRARLAPLSLHEISPDGTDVHRRCQR